MSEENRKPVETLYGTLVRCAQERADHVAVVANGEALSYAALLRRVDALREEFERVGSSLCGGRVYILDVGKLDLLVAVLATIGSGGVAVLAAGGDEAILEDCDPIIVVSNDLNTRGAGTPFYVAPASMSPSSAASMGDRTAADDSAAMILYTSGTTSGVRRGAVLTHGMLSFTTAYMNEMMHLDASVREYVVSPLDHSFGFARCRAVLGVGGTLVFDDGPFNPARVLMGIQHQQCNSISSVSAAFAILLQRFEKHLAKLGATVQWVEIGSLPLSVAMKHQMLALMPSARIFMHYGLTEASRTTLLDLRTDQSRIGSVGRASPGVQVRLAEDGEVLVKGPNVTPGYWRRDVEWQERYCDGWLHTGDLGWMDDDGYLFIEGRKDDVINVGGEKILPGPVEEALADLLPEEIFCVLGVPDPQGVLGEVPVLAVENASPPDVSVVRSHLAGRVPAHAYPRRVYEFQTFPRTENGKIQRRHMRSAIASQSHD